MPQFYGTVEGFRQYHVARGHPISAEIMADDEAIAGALLVASEWLDARYRGRFPGIKVVGRAQEREWPRMNATDIYGEDLGNVIVPREIEAATYEAAAIQAATPGALSVNYTPNKYKSVSISGAISVEYGSIESVADMQTQFAIIAEILATILIVPRGTTSYVGSSIR